MEGFLVKENIEDPFAKLMIIERLAKILNTAFFNQHFWRWKIRNTAQTSKNAISEEEDLKSTEQLYMHTTATLL